MFDLMLETAWRDAPADLDVWLASYVHRRYGSSDASLLSAWTTFANTFYTGEKSSTFGPWGGVLEKRPNMEMSDGIFYSQDDAVDGLKTLLSASHLVGDTDTYQYDVVDVTRQLLVNLMCTFNTNHTTAFNTMNSTAMNLAAQQIREILADLQTLLQTNAYFMLGPWVEDASKWGESDEEKEVMIFNGKNILTLWGPKAENGDYAAKHWAGLVDTYYAHRWELFLEAAAADLAKGVPFNATAFDQEALVFEQSWQTAHHEYTTVPIGDSIAVAKEMVQKYFSG